jgi:hypothetical protein
MYAGLNDQPDVVGDRKLHWINFGPNLVLREVIIGAKCSPANSRKVEEAVKPYGDAVKCCWADMRRDAFLLVKQDHPPGGPD